MDKIFNSFFSILMRKVNLLAKVIIDKDYNKSEKMEIIESVISKFCSTWDLFIDSLLIECFYKDTSEFSNYTGYKIKKHISRNNCKAILFNLKYTDFKNVGNLKGETKKILIPIYNPFSSISKDDSDIIDEFYKFRNYLAHYSDFSKRTLSKIYLGSYNLNKFVEPGKFMLTEVENPKRLIINKYIDSFYNAANTMKQFLRL